MREDKLEEEFKKFKNRDALGLAVDHKGRFRGSPDVTSEYQAWLDEVVSLELYERLSTKPQTWPELVKDFPGPFLPGREASLGRAMKWLSQHGALNITRIPHKNLSGYEWEDTIYSINPLQRLAML